jgi:NADPH:quinone reductase-like Zn-dependent oxidoreductase
MICTPAYNLLIYRLGGTVVTTCSPHNFELLKSLGADLAVDYKSLTAVSDIKDFTGNQLSLVLDCIGGSSGERICYDSFGPSGGKYATIVFSTEERRAEIEHFMVMAYDSFGSFFRKWNRDFPANPELYKFTAEFWGLVLPLLAKGSLKPHPSREGKALEGILDGLDEMKTGRYSGERLIYTL